NTYPSETTELKLDHPVFHNGVTLASLTVRRPKVRDHLIAKKMAKTEEDQDIKLMSLLAGVDDDIIQELDMDDY
ncbi:phage tail assembly protein, partial [Vibrio sp. 10N.261.45.A7]